MDADGVIGIGITATAVGLVVGGIAAAVARKKWESISRSSQVNVTTILFSFCVDAAYKCTLCMDGGDKLSLNAIRVFKLAFFHLAVLI